MSPKFIVSSTLAIPPRNTLPIAPGVLVPVNDLAINSGVFSSDGIPIPSTSQNATFFSFGGGPQIISLYSEATPLADRRPYGGATRNQIYGSSRYGSGAGSVAEQGMGNNYPWTPRSSLTQAMVRFSFGFWPVFWGNGYGGSYEYGASQDGLALRPGGEQLAIVASLDPITANHTSWYYIIADTATIRGLSPILKLPVSQGGCGMNDRTPLFTFNSNDTIVKPNGGEAPFQAVTIQPSSVLQYYRTSSVALGSIVYENEYAGGNNTNLGYWEQTPFDINLLDAGDGLFNLTTQQDFLTCLNHTIAGSIPIMDAVTTPSPSSSASQQHLSLGEKIGIGFGAAIFLFILLTIVWKIVLMREKGIYSFFSSSRPTSGIPLKNAGARQDSPPRPWQRFGNSGTSTPEGLEERRTDHSRRSEY